MSLFYRATIMFLISDQHHQTYLNQKKKLILKERRRIDTNFCPLRIELDNSNNNNNILINSNTTTTTPMSRLSHFNNHFINSKGQPMQRTRKYFTSNGHKFLFNNT